MKILQLIDYFQPKIGYQETFLSKELIRLGHKIWIVTSDRYYPFANFEKSYGSLLGDRFVGRGRKIEEGIEVIRLPTLEIPKTPLVYLKGFKKSLQLLKPDLVYCHGVYSLSSYLAAVYKNDLGYKLIYDSHAADFNTDFNGSLLKKLYHFIYKKIIAKKIIDVKDLIFAVGDNEQKFLCQDLNLYYKKVPVIRLGVDTDLFTYSFKLRCKIRKQLGFNRNDLIIVNTGKLTENKNIHVLCHAVKLLNNPKVKLLLIGGGDENYISKLHKIVGKNQVLLHLNIVENSRLPSYYSASDIASWPGNFSLSIHEALSCGLPVVIPEFWSTSYLDNKGVLTYKRGDIHGLLKVISELVYNNKLRNDLGKLGSEYIRNTLSWKKITRQLLEILP